ncbi:MAG: HD domain-containing protein [Chloroflexota bacterium]
MEGLLLKTAGRYLPYFAGASFRRMNSTSVSSFPQGQIEPEIRSLLVRIRDLLTEEGIAAYLVGGFVRDVLLGRVTADIDIAVAADALEVTERVATVLGGRAVLLDKVNKVGRVVLPDEPKPTGKGRLEIDFSTFEGTIEPDLLRRDFTIDAMAVDLRQMGQERIQVIDPFHGQMDQQKRIIRAVTATAFVADPVRLLRAVRLAVELGFEIEENTETIIKRDAHLIADVAGERVREELIRLLAVAGAGRFLSYLDDLGLLTALFPELETARGVTQPKEHFWDVLNHSLRAVMAVDFILRRGDWEYADAGALAAVPWGQDLVEHFNQEISCGSRRAALLKLAALLHDVAKPQAKALDADGRVRFLGHPQQGAAITAGILERLRFSSREVKLVESEVRYHLRPGQMSQEGLPTRRAIYRYFRDAGDAAIDTLFLSLADHLATRGPNFDTERWREHTEMVAYALAERFQEESVVHPPKLVSGDDLINLFSLSPGPKFKEVLEAVREAQAAGEVTTREEALAYIGNYPLTRSDKENA